MPHCEVTSYFLAVMIALSIILGKLFILDGLGYTIDLLGYSQNVFFIVLFLAGVGYLGVIYYRISKKKKPIFILQFWKAK